MPVLSMSWVCSLHAPLELADQYRTAVPGQWGRKTAEDVRRLTGCGDAPRLRTKSQVRRNGFRTPARYPTSSRHRSKICRAGADPIEMQSMDGPDLKPDVRQ